MDDVRLTAVEDQVFAMLEQHLWTIEAVARGNLEPTQEHAQMVYAAVLAIIKARSERLADNG